MSQNTSQPVKRPQDSQKIVPDTGKRGVQPLGEAKPYPPRPVPPIAKKGH